MTNHREPYVDDNRLMRGNIGDEPRWPATPYIDEEQQL